MSDEPEFSIHFVLARTRARQEVFVFSLHLYAANGCGTVSKG